MNPVIAVTTLNSSSTLLQKQGIDTEVSPLDDFITDRYTKILSTSLGLTKPANFEKSKIGILALCKELVEMC